MSWGGWKEADDVRGEKWRTSRLGDWGQVPLGGEPLEENPPLTRHFCPVLVEC